MEVEGTLNPRPLTHVYEELEEPISPSSCIGQRLLSPIPKTQDSISGTTATELSKRQKHLDLVLKHFWNRWRREYLSELREHHLGKKTSRSRVIKKGDVVCVHEDNVPRQRWKLATVQELIHGRDNLVLAAVVRLASKRARVEIQRPEQKLSPVEVYELHDAGLVTRRMWLQPRQSSDLYRRKQWRPYVVGNQCVEVQLSVQGTLINFER